MKGLRRSTTRALSPRPLASENDGDYPWEQVRRYSPTLFPEDGNLLRPTVFAPDIAVRVDPIMTSSDEYRRRAGECLLFTNYVRDERTKHLLVEMARSWHDLAERADQQELAGKRARRHSSKSGSGGSDKT